MHGVMYEHGAEKKSFSLLQVMALSDKVAAKSDIALGVQEFQNGDLLQIFNSISAGKELLSLDIEFEQGEKSMQLYQKNFDRKLWNLLFSMGLPARLTKSDGRVVDGSLHRFYEYGMEYNDWRVIDFRITLDEYASHHPIENGDRLTVFSCITEGNIKRQWKIEMDDKPSILGEKINLADISFNEKGLDIAVQTIPNVITQTFTCPPQEIMEYLCRRAFPAHIVR